MKLPTLLTICKACRGRGVVAGADGDPAVCPNCGGAGQAPMKAMRVPFDYSFPVINVPGGSLDPVQLALQLDDDSYFEQTHWVFSANPGVGSAGFPYAIQIVDQSTGWNFSNVGIFNPNFASTALAPFPLLAPFIWTPLAQAQLNLVPTGGGPESHDSIQLVMKGFKLFAPDGSPLQVAA